MTEESFEYDLEEWRQIAYQLQMEDDSEETRLELTSALLDMNKFLQQKQTDYENHFKQQIAVEEEEIRALKDRISDIEAKDGYKSRDVNHDDFVSVWKTLRIEEWQQAFDALNTDERGTSTVAAIMDRLIKILMISFKKCEEHANRCLEDLHFSAVFPGEEKTDYTKHKLPNDTDHDLLQACRLCRKKSVAFCIDSIKMTVSDDILKDGKTSPLFVSKSQRVQTALREYLQRCVEFSWIAKVQEAPVSIVTDPKREGFREILSQFRHYNDVPNKFTVDWPALVVDNVVVSPWELYDNSADRPMPEPLQEAKVYNTSKVRAEVTEENLDWDPDENVLQYEEKIKKTGEVTKTPETDVGRMRVPPPKTAQKPKQDDSRGKGGTRNKQEVKMNKKESNINKHVRFGKGKQENPGNKNINF